MKKHYIVYFLLLALSKGAYGQFSSFDETAYFGLSTPTGTNQSESILLEARPILKVPLYNRLNSDLGKRKRYSPTASIIFDPQFRMYNSNSRPVKMPTYRIFLSAGVTRQIGSDLNSPDALISLAAEHGHYSNGQFGCVWGSSMDNDSTCMALSANADNIDAPAMLNRNSGEYSTNFARAKLKLMYFLRSYPINDAGSTRGGKVKRSVQGTIAYTKLVDWLAGADIGGYDDHAHLFYPMNQFYVELAYEHYFAHNSNRHIRIGAEYWYRPSGNAFIYPNNFAITGAYFLQNNLGFFIKGEYGQDSYNIRFVDQIARVMGGLMYRVGDRLTWGPRRQ
ncbi:MAG: hypothetical protein K0Q79_3168 [Flavipsychrobacter sp.]|jgi:hypothetical protein|nr:hypothetical protein [Flavipsychrobacter sp.]